MKAISLKIKAVLLAKAQEKLQSQIQDMEGQLAELLKAGAEHGKSSAGDKYETQGEMLKQSRNMLEVQWSRTKQMLDQLNRIPFQALQSVQEGALIKLSIGCIWISVPLGKLEHEGHEYQLISKDAPLSLTLKSLKTGESCLFRGKKMVVEKLI